MDTQNAPDELWTDVIDISSERDAMKVILDAAEGGRPVHLYKLDEEYYIISNSSLSDEQVQAVWSDFVGPAE